MIKHCNALIPMPEVCEKGDHWMHDLAIPVVIDMGEGRTETVKTLTGTLHRCPICEHEFHYPTADDIADMVKRAR